MGGGGGGVRRGGVYKQSAMLLASCTATCTIGRLFNEIHWLQGVAGGGGVVNISTDSASIGHSHLQGIAAEAVVGDFELAVLGGFKTTLLW